MPGSPSTGRRPSYSSVLFVTGPIASGKTSIADALAEVIHGARRATFSTGLRTLATAERVDVSTRERMQNFGEETARQRWRVLWDATVSRAVPRIGANLIVDGLRHSHIYEELRNDGQLKVGLLSLVPATDMVSQRIEARGESVESGAHIVESQWQALDAAADVSLRGQAALNPLPRALAELFRWLWS